MSKMIKVLIADDAAFMRDRLKRIAEQSGEILVCGAAADGKEAYALCMREKPDVVLMDLQMPNGTGDVITRKIKKELPGTKVIFVTVFDDRRSVAAACSSGADGYILKEDIDIEKLVGAIKNTYAGLSNVSAGVFKKVNANIFSVNPPDNLTEKDAKIMALTGNAKSNQEIAEELHCGVGTIKNDISKILKKFGFKDRTELAVYAVKNGMDKWEEET
ncbi:MAG: response regulator transcription factor [Peptococcaceae bacterium]|jgi:DNA-binding NarL/FixJ family response regulator|nr:response regulator transcription factor [Peptococcaceae bacterium]MDR2736970.1 response regulator transcription factor [Gracilibacteraceae bacterium]